MTCLIIIAVVSAVTFVIGVLVGIDLATHEPATTISVTEGTDKPKEEK
jgi:hypothetical protein